MLKVWFESPDLLGDGQMSHWQVNQTPVTLPGPDAELLI